MDKRRLQAAALLLIIALSPACGPKTPAEEAGIDQEITRNIMWRYHNDIRFAEVRVSHRARRHGLSKYGVGNRLWRGLADLVGVSWLKHRLVRFSLRDDERAG